MAHTLLPRPPHLVGKQHHDGVWPRPWWHVLDGEGVVVILDDVEVDVCLGHTYHARGALDPNANITCGGRQRTLVSQGEGEVWEGQRNLDSPWPASLQSTVK